MVFTAKQTKWNGTKEEGLELLKIIERYCVCKKTAEGVRVSTCPPHKIIVSDQRALDGLLFGRRIAAKLLQEEFYIPEDAEDATPIQVEKSTAQILGLNFGERRL